MSKENHVGKAAILGLDIDELAAELARAVNSGKYASPMKEPEDKAPPEIVETLSETLQQISGICRSYGLSFAFMLEYAYNSEEGSWAAMVGGASDTSQTSPHFDSVREISQEGHEAALPALVRYLLLKGTTEKRQVTDSEGNTWFPSGNNPKA